MSGDRNDGRILHAAEHLCILVCRALIASLVLASATFADVGSLPARFDVVGVAADDTLNIRERDDPTAPIIGELAHDARHIVIVGTNTAGTWGRLNWGEVAGWISMRYLARQPGQDNSGLPQNLSCFGTEPFWSLALGPQDYTLKTPDEHVGIDPPIFLRSMTQTDRFALITQSEHGALNGIIRREECSDGMSDQSFGLSIDLIYRDSSVLSGCCDLPR